MEKLVSIITPCYNSEAYIEQTIRSVLAQTYTHWEWWIVDDCSDDSSVQMIEKHTVDPRINLIRLNKNSGAAVARNHGIKNAVGRYITFIDSDDLWLPEFLEKSISFLETNKEELVYSSYKRVDETLKPLLNDFVAEDHIDYKRLLYNCPIPMLTAVYDSSRIGKIEIPDVELREDYAMWLEILKKIPEARSISESLAVYRIRKTSYSRNKLKILKKQFAVYYKFLNLSLPQSVYFTFHWMLNGIKKYERFKFRNNR